MREKLMVLMAPQMIHACEKSCGECDREPGQDWKDCVWDVGQRPGPGGGFMRGDNGRNSRKTFESPTD